MSNIKEFQELVKKGDLDSVRAALVEDSSLLNATNEAGQSAYLLARYYRQPAVADYLLSQNPELDVFHKCVAGQIDAALEEIDRNPSLLQAHNSDGWTPLHLAAFFNHPELAKALINRNAALEALSTNAMQNTPLHAAAAGGGIASLALLLDAGADVNARQHGGWTALHAAAQTGNQEMAKLLLFHGADPALRAENNQSALDLALLQGHAGMAALLEQQGTPLQ